MKKHLLLFITLILCIKVSYSQTNVNADTTAIGLGATTTDPNYKFRYQNYLIAHYGLGWYSDTDFSGGPMAYLGGYGGFKFFTEGSPRLTITAQGQVGIGMTTSPLYKFQIKMDNDFSVIQRSNSSNYAGLYYVTGPDNALNYNFLVGLRENSDDYHIFNGEQGVDALTINHSNNFIGLGTTNPSAALDIWNGAIHVVGGYAANYAVDGGYLAWDLSAGGGETNFINNIGGGNTGGFTFDNTTRSNVSTRLMTILGTGNVGIGTTTPDTKLAVNGTIHSKQVIVDLTGWPDYVFKPTYTLPPLSEVKTYIDKNQHLPDIPSEQELVEKGLNLGEMNKLLTKKVEELTLYLIEKDKELKKQEARMDKMQGEINQLLKKD